MMTRFIVALFLFLSAAPPAFAFGSKVLDVREIKTPAGIEVWLVEDKSVPVISMSFSFAGGLAYDPEDKPGVARMVSILLDEGAGDLTSQEFQAQLSDNAIGLQFTPGRDDFYGRLKTLRANKDTAFKLLGLALSQPRFDKDAFERMRNANISEIKDDMGEPGWLAARTFNGTVFEGHPYAAPGFGTLESMAQITRDDLRAFVRAQFARDVLKVAIAGDITAEEAAAAVDSVFSGLPAHAEKAEGDAVELKAVGKTVLLPLNTPQTTVIIGEAGITRDDKDWETAAIMNYILGGSDFDARLMREIRKKRGLTYGVYSMLVSMKYAGLVQVELSASNDKVPEALDVLRQEWKKMAEEGPMEQEVLDAKSYLTGSLPLALTSTDDISDTLNSLQRDGLGPDYINARNDRLNTVTVADVRRVAARLLKPENLTVILVGQPQGITADIMLDHPPGMAVPQQKQ
jgi:zinc protease